LQIKSKLSVGHTADSKPVKQEVNSTGILPILLFPVSKEVYNLAREPLQEGKAQFIKMDSFSSHSVE
jgi:hypothetical protein